MARVRLLVACLMLGLVGFVFAQDKDTAKDKPKDNPDDKKLKGFLPAGFKKLGLTEKQVQAIYKIQADYRAKKDEITRQLNRLKEAEREEIEKTLTDAQKKELKAIRTGEKDKKDK
jgi:Spy/CpxP family protein refolding chaperone